MAGFGRPAAAVLALVLLGASAACGEDARPLPIDRSMIMALPGGEREALVHHPVTARPGAPLVVVLHGAGVPAEVAGTEYGWSALADREGLVVVYPSGLDHTWNAGRCCGQSALDDVDDLGFLHQLTRRLAGEDRVDLDRVFAVGLSNGAMLAYAWGCARPGELAGIGVVAGALAVDCTVPDPLSVVAVHGAVDDVVPVGGGGRAGRPQHRPLGASLAPFHAAAGCPRAPEGRQAEGATTAIWRCANGHVVVQDVIDGLGHVWPGAGPEAGTDDGPGDATGFIWRHLRGARA